MTFEEFFKRKKIDLAALAQDEAGLFTEFKNHYEQMGEKSFDHTKKYWFNQLRRRFPAAPEMKVEKVKIENALAEQTITGELTSPAKDISTGFKPRFKAAATTTPLQSEPAKQNVERQDTPQDPDADKPTVGFKPRFKAAMVTKPADTIAEKIVEAPVVPDAKEERADPALTGAPKVGFKPRFKAAMVAKTIETPEESEVIVPEPSKDIILPAVADVPKVGFKPRFKAAMVARPPLIETADEHPETQPPAVSEEATIKLPAEDSETKPEGE